MWVDFRLVPRGRRRRSALGRLRGLVAAAGILAAAALGAAAGSTGASSDPATRDPGPVRSAAGDASATPGARVVEEIAAAFLDLDTYRAEFEQTQAWVGQDEISGYRGTLYLKRPNLFRIEYSEPEGHIQVSDGATVWTYVPENGEVLATRLPEEGGGGDPLRWILEQGTPDPVVAAGQVEGRAARVVTLRPPEGMGVSEVRIWTPLDAGEILQYEVVDSAGNRSIYRILSSRRDPPLKPSLFEFRPPDGIPVVEVGSP